MNSPAAVSSFAALAHDSRLAIYRLLVQAGPTGLSVGEIGASVRVAPATLSFHLKALTHAGLVGARQDGRFIYYSANFERMSALIGFLTEKCCINDGMGCEVGEGWARKAGCSPRSAQAKTKEPK